MQILHITTHMGGGVGKVLSTITAYAQRKNSRYKHKILMLDSPEKKQFLDICEKNDIEVICSTDPKIINFEISNSDIVQLSWWHHPTMAEFLHNFPQIPTRLIIWSHISGCTYPELPFTFVEKAHKNFFTTNYTFESPYWSSTQKQYVKENAEVIYGAGELNYTAKANYDHQDHFTIGYVGTLNYSKLNPNFIDYCCNVNVPDAKFVLVGDTDNKAVIESEAQKRGILNCLEFTGYTENVYKELSRFDVFGYPLNPWHFGATENALLEALASGIPVVALNQGAERYLIQHMETGLLADNVEHYGQLIRYLYENPDERERIGENGRKYVMRNFSLDKTVTKMSRAYDEVLLMEPRVFEFGSVFGNKPYEWFLACLGADRRLFEDSIDEQIMKEPLRSRELKNKIKNCRYILKEKSKSSVNHFANRFTEDRIIRYWNDIIKY